MLNAAVSLRCWHRWARREEEPWFPRPQKIAIIVRGQRWFGGGVVHSDEVASNIRRDCNRFAEHGVPARDKRESLPEEGRDPDRCQFLLGKHLDFQIFELNGHRVAAVHLEGNHTVLARLGAVIQKLSRQHSVD